MRLVLPFLSVVLNALILHAEEPASLNNHFRHLRGSTKVTICHFPQGNPTNFHTVRIADKALEAHLAHGDLVGACNEHCVAICDDGDLCTIDDPALQDCEENDCPPFPRAPVDCDDGDLCTINSCNSTIGCISTDVDCDDGNPCTINSCDSTIGCISTAADCDDGDLCTITSCDSTTGCISIAVKCDDGDPCTINSCNATTGECDSADVVCDDGDPCTIDSCDVTTGDCVSAAVECDDGNQCTIDSCNPATGECASTDVACEDNNPCTEDSCNPIDGACVFKKIEPTITFHTKFDNSAILKYSDPAVTANATDALKTIYPELFSLEGKRCTLTIKGFDGMFPFPVSSEVWRQGEEWRSRLLRNFRLYGTALGGNGFSVESNCTENLPFFLARSEENLPNKAAKTALLGIASSVFANVSSGGQGGYHDFDSLTFQFLHIDESQCCNPSLGPQWVPKGDVFINAFFIPADFMDHSEAGVITFPGDQQITLLSS